MDKQTSRLADRHTNRQKLYWDALNGQTEKWTGLTFWCRNGSVMPRARWREDVASLKTIDMRKDSTLKCVCRCVCVRSYTSMCVYVHVCSSGLYLCSLYVCVCVCVYVHVCLILLWPLPRYWIKVANMLPKQGAKRLKILMAKDLYTHTHTHARAHTHTQGRRTTGTSVPQFYLLSSRMF